LLYRIKIEEGLLMRDPKYREFMAQTPYRLLPGVY
jgi:hypothetical protein